MNDTALNDPAETIAIIGMVCRFPGASHTEAFWNNLRDGVESITFFSDRELLQAGADPERLKSPRYVKARPILENLEYFDAAFFGISPAEAELMDPQHRFFLECAWEALENAGYDPETCPGRIGVYAGIDPSAYWMNNLSRHPNGLPIILGNESSYLCTRASYKLNLKGPSVSVQTACSTALVAVHTACQSLLNSECDMALAGSMGCRSSQRSGYEYQEKGIYAPDGHCRPFDADARGTVFGSGIGVVILKRLSDALADGDTIQAVIRGSAVNNDGSLKIGFTAPSLDGQAAVIAEAIGIAGIDPGTIGYVEAHGTGTELGDPVEVAALTRAFRLGTRKKNFCALGSVKANVGHLSTAAGMASLIKTVLVLKHKAIPPLLHFRRPNPKIDFANSPFYVNTTLREWPGSGEPRRAGVSSFGMGGTNAHVVLEEAPAAEPSGPSRRLHLWCWSARSQTGLEKMTAGMARYLRDHPDLNPADTAYTLHLGRKTFKHRCFMIGTTPAEALQTLEQRTPDRRTSGSDGPEGRPVIFMFPGQGSQYVHMGRGLYEREPLFRKQIDACAEGFRPHLGIDLRGLLYPSEAGATDGQLQQTQYAQPALFMIEYALAQLWMDWGIRPQAMIGHGIGEYTAACLAGVFSPADAFRLVALRGRLMQSLPPGAMVSAAISEDELQPLLSGELALAAVNGSTQCVVSGSLEAIGRLEGILKTRDIQSRRLHTAHAAHSAMMDPILKIFEKEIGRNPLGQPRIPYVSNLSGTRITPEQAVDPAYWVQHLRRTVRFSAGLAALSRAGEPILLEVGPGESLSALARRLPESRTGAILSCLRHPREQQEDDWSLLQCLGKMWAVGAVVDWPAYYRNERRRRVPLPTYPFERQRYWIDPQPASLQPGRGVQPAPPDAEAAQDSPLPTYARPALPDAYAGPRNDIERRLLALWEQLLGVHSLGIDDNFFDLGGHSLLAIQLITRIKEAYQIDLPVAVIAQTPTVRDLAEFIGNHTRERPWSPLVPLRKAGSRRPLYCIHPVTGTVLCYMDLARHLPPEQTVYAFQAPGFEKGQKTRRSVAEMAKDYLDAVYEAQPEGPYYFCGWSAGGIIAYEMAQQARAADKEIGLLALIDTFPLVHPTGSKLTGFFALLFYSLTQAVAHLRELLRTIDFQSLGILNILRRLTAIAKINYSTLGYAMQPYDGSVILFQTEGHAKIMKQNPDRSIASYVKGGLEIIGLPGPHLMIVYEPNVRWLAKHLQQFLSIHQTDNVSSSATGHTVGKSNG